MASLGRWDLAFDDSGGDSLMDTPAGIFARLAETVADELAPPALLALLKHPLLRLGQAQGAIAKTVGDLELALMRGPRPAAGSTGLAQDFARFRDELGRLQRKEPSAIHHSEPRAQLEDADLDDVQALIANLTAALKPLEDLRRGKLHDLMEFAARHYDALKTLTTDDKGVYLAFEDADGGALSKAFDDLFQTVDPSPEDSKPSASGLTLTLGDYPDVFETTFGDRIAAARNRRHRFASMVRSKRA
jgi:ATP-dependent helicase/nuclease subunit B